jgi:hypothetical protein
LGFQKRQRAASPPVRLLPETVEQRAVLVRAKFSIDQ